MNISCLYNDMKTIKLKFQKKIRRGQQFKKLQRKFKTKGNSVSKEMFKYFEHITGKEENWYKFKNNVLIAAKIMLWRMLSLTKQTK